MKNSPQPKPAQRTFFTPQQVSENCVVLAKLAEQANDTIAKIVGLEMAVSEAKAALAATRKSYAELKPQLDAVLALFEA